VFDKYDQDQNGELSKDEFRMLVIYLWQQQYDLIPNSQELDVIVATMMEKADINKDGILQKEEFMRFCSSK
jgi:Ca2+-binding EF-hand superfamily protein